MSRWHTATLASVVGLVLLQFSTTASAVPSFARQTGMPCAACHTSYPELTAFGRQFKLQGYTLTAGKQIQSEPSGGSAGLKINEIPPLSAMVQLSASHMQKAQAATATQDGVQNNDVGFPQEASLFFAGAISEKAGAFVQITYAQDSGGFEWDNTDVRYADTWGNTIWGLTLNNNPSVQDLWNSTPAWGFPFAASAAANTPAAATLVDGALAGDVGGGGAYALFGGHLYTELSAYRSTHQGQAAPTDGTVSGAASSNTISGLAPYVRIAWQQGFGSDYLMVGGYALQASLFPTGITGPTDKYTDTALDAQYEHPLGSNELTVRASWIHEKRDLDASFAAAAASNSSDTLNTARINGSYHFGQQYTATAAYFQTTGGADPALYADSALTGKPDSRGEIVQATYLPWQNVQLSAQYVIYNKFDGAGSNYDGNGRNASDNDTLYALLWLMW